MWGHFCALIDIVALHAHSTRGIARPRDTEPEGLKRASAYRFRKWRHSGEHVSCHHGTPGDVVAWPSDPSATVLSRSTGLERGDWHRSKRGRRR